MLECFHRLADERIRKAQEDGAFDNLEGAGRPLELEDDSMIPPDLRMAYKILKNAGYVPREVSDRKDIMTAIDLLEQAGDEQERYRQIRKLNALVSRYNMRTGRSLALEEHEGYYQRIVERVTVHRPEDDDGQLRPLP